MKNYLFVLRKSAYSGIYVQEMVDIILTTAAFEQTVSVLLLDDAVFHLKKQQNASIQKLKDNAALFSSFALYEIQEIYLEEESLYERGLQHEDLFLHIKTIARHEVGYFMSQFDILIAG